MTTNLWRNDVFRDIWHIFYNFSGHPQKLCYTTSGVYYTGIYYSLEVINLEYCNYR